MTRISVQHIASATLIIISPPPQLIPFIPPLPCRLFNRPSDLLINHLLLTQSLLQLLLILISSHSSPTNPIEDPPRAEIPFRPTEQMHIHPASDPAQEEARRHNRVPGEGECLLDGYHGEVEEVRKHMEAEEHGRHVSGHEVGEKVGEWMVVVCCEGEGSP